MERLAQFFKAFSDTTRLRIIALLANGELCGCDLMDILGEPQSKISRHLTYLKHSEITESRRVGVWMHYRLKESQNGIFKAQIHLLKKTFNPATISGRQGEAFRIEKEREVQGYNEIEVYSIIKEF